MLKAVCLLTECQGGIRGYVTFTEQTDGQTLVSVRIVGLKPGYHGFHIHAKGNLLEGCQSLCAHFNPDGVAHGGRNDPKGRRHVGDLGNVYADENGIVYDDFTDPLIKLRGPSSIVGRSVVVHADRDDLGRGGLDRFGNIVNLDRHKESLKTGNAGKRIACGVIGWA